MKYLIFADCHYGYNQGAKASIVDVVDMYIDMFGSVGKVLVLGDHIELWRRTVSDVLIECGDVIDDLECMDVVYVKGNHDFIIDELLSNRDIDIVLRYEKEKYVFEHGHYIDYLSADMPFIGIDDYDNFAREMCYSNTTIGSFLSRLWSCHKLLSVKINSILSRRGYLMRKKFEKMDALSSVLCGRDRKLVVGHFHSLWIGKNVIALPSFSDNYFASLDSDGLAIYRYDVSGGVTEIKSLSV